MQAAENKDEVLPLELVRARLWICLQENKQTKKKTRKKSVIQLFNNQE